MSETCSVELEYLIGWCGGGKSNGNNQRRCTGCRVSVGTVSNVLNGGRVSEARRKLVEASIAKNWGIR